MNKNYEEIEAVFKAYSLCKVQPDKVPEGWFTSEEYCERLGIGSSTAKKQLAALQKAKMVDVCIFRLQKTNRVYPVPHYKLCKPTNKTR